MAAAVIVLGLFAVLFAFAPFVTAWAFNTVVTGIFNGPGPIGWIEGLAINCLLGPIGKVSRHS